MICLTAEKKAARPAAYPSLRLFLSTECSLDHETNAKANIMVGVVLKLDRIVIDLDSPKVNMIV